MRSLALILLAGCSLMPPVLAGTDEYVCNPPMTIAGNEPSLCYWDGSDGWCVYDVGRCAGTWHRAACDADWEQAYSECRLPLKFYGRRDA